MDSPSKPVREGAAEVPALDGSAKKVKVEPAATEQPSPNRPAVLGVGLLLGEAEKPEVLHRPQESLRCNGSRGQEGRAGGKLQGADV